MRLLFTAIACSFLWATIPAHGEQRLPYKARVTSDKVFAYSGPGQDHYPTDPLKVGEEVEVYGRRPDGWCAIRPVAGSFTWISSEYIEPTVDNLAKVTDDNVAVRVGSQCGDQRDAIAVHLRKGEIVEILEVASRDLDSDEGILVKISPPSGEFRWVERKYLDSAAASSSKSATPAKSQPLSTEAYEAELERLELDLSIMVSNQPTSWSFDSLRERANWLVDHAPTAVDRGRSRHLANRLARFEDIKQRQDGVLAMHNATSQTARLLATASSRINNNRIAGILPPNSRENLPQPANLAAADRPAIGSISDIDDRFDGVGILAQVKSSKLGAPGYALVDATGAVRCYVTPAPGVNLQKYLGKQVGVTGTRGYMLEQQASHLMARHVTALDNSSLR